MTQELIKQIEETSQVIEDACRRIDELKAENLSLRKAVEAEREACAKICDEFFKGNKSINYSDTIAICIRARDYQKGETD